MVAQLEENLIHLECRRHRLDEHGRADGAGLKTELLFREREDVVPKSCFQMALQLGQVEVRVAASMLQLSHVVEGEEAEIKEAGGDR